MKLHCRGEMKKQVNILRSQKLCRKTKQRKGIGKASYICVCLVLRGYIL